MVLEADGKSISGEDREQEISFEIGRQLQDPAMAVRNRRRRARRQLRHFSIPTQIHFFQDDSNNRTMMEVVHLGSSRPAVSDRLGAG